MLVARTATAGALKRAAAKAAAHCSSPHHPPVARRTMASVSSYTSAWTPKLPFPVSPQQRSTAEALLVLGMGIGAFQAITYGTTTMRPRDGTMAEREAEAEAARQMVEAREAHKAKLNKVAVIATGRDGDYVAGKGNAGGHTGFSGSTKAEQKPEEAPTFKFKQDELGEPPVVQENDEENEDDEEGESE